MKIIFALIASLVSVSALADADVKIMSFRYIESGNLRSPAAELCGALIVPTGKPEMVRLTIDPGSKAPGLYYAWAGPEGKFCSVVATYTGNAEAGLAK